MGAGRGGQAAGYFEGLAGNNNVSFNVMHDGPRAGANFNDGLRPGQAGVVVLDHMAAYVCAELEGLKGDFRSWQRATVLIPTRGTACTQHNAKSFVDFSAGSKNKVRLWKQSAVLLRYCAGALLSS